MVYIFKDRLIRVEWTIYKGISPVKEDFSRSNVKVFLLGNREKYLLQARADKGTLYVDIPSGLKEGTYSIEAIWVKNMDHVFDTRNICRSKKEDLFSITEFEDEATNIGEGVVVLKVKTSTATYGYDGLSSYELAVLRGDWNGTEGEWLKHERYVSVLDSRGDSEVDTMSQKAITDELEAQDNAIEDIQEETNRLGDRVEEAEGKVNDMGDVVDEIKSHAPVSARPAGFKPDIDLIPEITVDRAWRDHEGNVIRDTYITRRGLRNEIIDITNQQVTDLKPGSVDPDDLSEATKQLIGNKSITNIPDEEDITVTDNQTLKLKDKEYAPKDYSGMGRVYLRKHYVNGVNTLTQHMMRKPNTIYIIQYDYCLAGQTIKVPDNCVLDFQGGSLRNGIIVGNNTNIISSTVLIFKQDLIIDGNWNIEHYFIEWFTNNFNNDVSEYFNKLDGKTIKLLNNKTYRVSNILIHAKTSIIGSGMNTIIQQIDGSSGDCLTCEDWVDGLLTNFTIIGGKNIKQLNFEQALIKVRTTKEWQLNHPDKFPYENAGSTYYSTITNISVKFSEYNGISYLSNGDIDNGIVCYYNWVIQTNNIWIINCRRYNFYNNSTDNRFSDIYSTYGGYADIYECGSSNIWNNVKTDGESGYKRFYELEDSIKNREELYKTSMKDTLGCAAVIIYNASNITFSNLDVQSNKVVGFKQILSFNCVIDMTLNNNGQSASQYKELKFVKYCPAIYLSTVRNSIINAVLYRFNNQYQSINIDDTSNIYSFIGNTININEEQFTISNAYYGVENVINFLKNRNVVNVNYIDSTYSSPVKQKLNSIYDHWYNNKFSSVATRVQDCLLPGDQALVLDSDAQGRDMLSTTDDYRVPFRKGHVYMMTSLQKIVGDGNTNIYPLGGENNGPAIFYVTLLDKKGTKVSPSLLLYQRTTSPIAKENEIFIVASMFQYTSDDIDDYVEGYLGLTCTHKHITNYVTSVNMYDLTQDLGLVNLPADLDSFVKYIFSYSKLDRGTKVFKDFEVLFPNIKSSQTGDITNTIEPLYDGMVFTNKDKRVYFSYNREWVDVNGVDGTLKREGSSSNRPVLNNVSNSVGFKYYDTDLKTIIIWNGENWTNIDGTLVDRIYLQKNNKFSKSNTVYKIIRDYDLNGSTLTIPSGCTLDFQGGKISNGIVKLNNTKILPNCCNIQDYITAEITGNYAIGQCLYDTTLNKPKWWTGSNWIDATGATV